MAAGRIAAEKNAVLHPRPRMEDRRDACFCRIALLDAGKGCRGAFFERDMSEKFTDYSVKDAVEVRPAEHEIFLSFNSDWQAEAFSDWLEIEGMTQFAKWLESRRQNYD
jgi:hypothetical protein